MPVISAAIDPITRIEGHLKINVNIDTVNGVQQVVDAWSQGTLFRGFEKILEGRDPRDAPFVAASPAGALNSLLDATLSFQEDSGAFAFTHAIPESRLMAVLDAVPALSHAYPAYAPPAVPAATTAGQARFWRQGGRTILIAPYAGDGNHNGTLVAQSRAPGGAWAALLVVETAGAYLVAFDDSLSGLRGVEVSLEFQDADGVEGSATQVLAVALANLPMVRKG